MKKRSFSSRGVLISVIAIALLLGTGLAAFCQARGDVNNDLTININDALMIARYSAGFTVPGFVVSVADVNCNGVVDITDALVVARYSAGMATICSTGAPTATPTIAPPTATPTPTFTGSTTRPPHASNPFSGTLKWYVNQEWSANASANGGSAIANCNTVVWMDRIGAINPTSGMGLAAHLDACLDQGANLFTLMIYDLPSRDCSASASNGELTCDAAGNGMTTYKTQFIDPIIAILDNPKYYSIHIITLLETDSLPNMVTNTTKFAKCQDVNDRGCYVQGIQYALNKLYPLTHCYKYLEIAHSAWLGWDDNFGKGVSLYKSVVQNTTNGVQSIDGFCDNVCNTLPSEEPFITDGNQSIGGVQIKQSRFYEWNPMVDEFQYMDAWYAQMKGTFPRCGMLLDTARNGWGGPNRPTKASTATEVNAFVDASRIDRRYHRGNWCNNKYAGLGERPRVAPRTNIQAYIWVKPPGESDGVSQSGIVDPNDPNKQFDTMCDPNGQNSYCNCGTTDALANMPHAGRFSTTLFKQLLANSYPAL